VFIASQNVNIGGFRNWRISARKLNPINAVGIIGKVSLGLCLDLSNKGEFFQQAHCFWGMTLL
jgi:hypothetical protein